MKAVSTRPSLFLMSFKAREREREEREKENDYCHLFFDWKIDNRIESWQNLASNELEYYCCKWYTPFLSIDLTSFLARVFFLAFVEQ